MSRVTFRLARHILGHGIIVEVMLDGEVRAAIYPKDDSFMVVTPHAVMTYDNGATSIPQIPGWTFTLKPRRYTVGPDGAIQFSE